MAKANEIPQITEASHVNVSQSEFTPDVEDKSSAEPLIKCAVIFFNQTIYFRKLAPIKIFVRTRRMILLVFLVALITLPSAYAQKIIAEGIRISAEEAEASHPITVISESEIKSKNFSTVADILRDVPGLEIVRQGGIGQPTSVFIRGARSEGTLVLIDSMEANDSMSPSDGFDFTMLSSDSISRIEIFLGPQSVRFGAGAMGGVINIITKEGAGFPQSNYSIELGSYATNRFSLGHSGKLNSLGYSLGIGRIYTQGYSAASQRSGNNEADGSEVFSTAGKLTWQASKTSRLETTIRYTDVKTDLDISGGAGGDDPNNTSHAKQLVFGLTGSERFFNDQLRSNLGFYFSEVGRDTRNKPDTVNANSSFDTFLGEKRKVQSDHELLLGENHTLRLGLQWREEDGFADSSFNGLATRIERKKQSVVGESLVYFFENENWFLDAGGRNDQSSQGVSVTSYRASIGRNFLTLGSKSYLSYGSGFKLPSLYQLYSLYGDANLRQENSRTLEATIEQKFTRSGLLSITYFDSKLQDLIDYNMTTNKYFNISEASSKGLEIQIDFSIYSEFRFVGKYTYLDSIDDSTGLALLRRPKNAWNASLRYDRKTSDLYVQYVEKSERPDVDPITFQRIANSAYGTLNIGGSHELAKWLRLTGRIENVFDATYEEVAGYGTPGASFYVGSSGVF